MAQSPSRIGYKRVSSVDQNTDRQLDGLELDFEFEDKASGKDTNRPELQRMLGMKWAPGSTIYVHSFDRLARSLSDLEAMVKDLTSRDITVQFMKEGKTFHPPGATQDAQKGAMDMLMLQMLGAFAQYERTLILERQREGIAKAKAKGVYKGRPRKVTEAEKVSRIVAEATQPGAVKAQVARAHGISRETLYQYIREAQPKAVQVA